LKSNLPSALRYFSAISSDNHSWVFVDSTIKSASRRVLRIYSPDSFKNLHIEIKAKQAVIVLRWDQESSLISWVIDQKINQYLGSQDLVIGRDKALAIKKQFEDI
jgi:hypothetical protein